MKATCLDIFIQEYPTKYKQGFTSEEILTLISKFHRLHKDKFYDALNGNTCMIVNTEIIHYHCDILTALRCGLENRSINQSEFD